MKETNPYRPRQLICDGDAGETFHQPEGDGILFVESGDAFIEELEGIYIVGIGFVPYFFIGRQDGMHIGQVDLCGTNAIGAEIGNDHDRFDRCTKRFVVKIPSITPTIWADQSPKNSLLPMTAAGSRT